MRSPRGLKAVGPYVVTKAMASGVSACLATPFKIHGVNYSISSACATSAHCIGNAVEQIQLGKQDIVFAGGGEELCWEMACEFDAMGALSTKYNDTPEKASRTYDANRDGFVIAGGGGMVVVEELEHARRVARTSMPKSSAMVRPPMARTWSPRLVKAQCAACRWRCMALIRRSTI
nr:3-oxoacyl-[acyl-carrier-protein] synthase 1 [Klebsiella pneumoniae]